MCHKDQLIHSRREFVSTGVGAAAIMLGLPPATIVRGLPDTPSELLKQQPLDTARNVASWIESSRIVTTDGVTWPADPNDPESVGTTLYTHSPGVVLFLLDLYNSTGNSTYLESACAGADHLLAHPPEEVEGGAGLYTGVAGLLFCLEETFRASGRQQYRGGAEQCLEWLHNAATDVGSGIEWNSSTDIIGGNAGVGLTLLYADSAMSRDASTDFAARAGRRLFDLGRPGVGGLKWSAMREYPRFMPNFSHGTAGVCYFLARLFEMTGEQEFLDGAMAGARYLQAVARTENDSFSVFHNEPDGLDLYYLSWCHGPPGTTRLFYQLAKTTGDAEWMEWVFRGARAVLKSGIPEQQTPGFWNNVSRCCGHVGVGEFFLSLYRETGDSSYMDFVDRLTADMVRRASDSVDGTRWVQAEHRTRPELLVAQTGYMQGAAGIGTYFLHLDANVNGGRPSITLPDSPF